MSAESEREVAADIYHMAADLNRVIDRAREIGLRVDLTIEAVKAPTLPVSSPHIVARVVKPIEPEGKK